MRRRTALLLLLPFGGGCLAETEIPEAPDLSELEAIYEEPTGTVAGSNLEVAAQRALDRLARIDQLGELDFVVDTLQALDETLEDYVADGDDDIGGRLPVRGLARVRRTCPGYEPLARPTVENGDLLMTATFTESQIDPVIFGRFRQCEFLVDENRLKLDASIDQFIGEGVRFDLTGLDAVLVRILGEVTFRGLGPVPVELDFRVFRDGLVETRVPLRTGDVIAFADVNERRAGLRGQDGVYCCDFAARQCSEVRNVECDGVDGAQVLRW